jgi:hypothetical protein
MPPNFVLLDSTLPDVTRLVAHEGQKLAAGVAMAKTLHRGHHPAPHLMAEVLAQFAGVLHFLRRAVASITLSSSWVAVYSPW